MAKFTFRRWVELDRVLEEKGLNLIDVSSQSKLDDKRTDISIQYLTAIRSGRYFYGPNKRVLTTLSDVLGVDVDDIRPREDDEDEIQAAA